MKKFIVLILMLSTSIVNGQQKPAWINDDRFIVNSPLVILRTTKDTIKTIYSSIITSVSHDSINSIQILKDKNAIKVYGELAKNGVIIVDFKPFFQFPVDQITLSTLLKEHPTHLPVYVDNSYIKYPDMLYLMRSEIQSISEETEPVTGTKYLNLVTSENIYRSDKFRFYKNDTDSIKHKPGEIMIR